MKPIWNGILNQKLIYNSLVAKQSNVNATLILDQQGSFFSMVGAWLRVASGVYIYIYIISTEIQQGLMSIR